MLDYSNIRVLTPNLLGNSLLEPYKSLHESFCDMSLYMCVGAWEGYKILATFFIYIKIMKVKFSGRLGKY